MYKTRKILAPLNTMLAAGEKGKERDKLYERREMNVPSSNYKLTTLCDMYLYVGKETHSQS